MLIQANRQRENENKQNLKQQLEQQIIMSSSQGKDVYRPWPQQCKYYGIFILEQFLSNTRLNIE